MKFRVIIIALAIAVLAAGALLLVRTSIVESTNIANGQSRSVIHIAGLEYVLSVSAPVDWMVRCDNKLNDLWVPEHRKSLLSVGGGNHIKFEYAGLRSMMLSVGNVGEVESASDSQLCSLHTIIYGLVNRGDVFYFQLEEAKDAGWLEDRGLVLIVEDEDPVDIRDLLGG